MKAAISLQAVEFRPDSREVVVRGEVKRLPWRAFDVLLLLAERAGSVVQKEEMLQSVWSGAAVDESDLTQAIAQIRKALGEVTPGKSYIETIPRIGYRISGEAVRAAAEVATETSTVPAPDLATPRTTTTWLKPVLAAAAMVVLDVTVVLLRRDRELREVDVSETPFTSFEGDEQSASFSPYGREVVFTWARPPGTPDIFFKSIESENVRPFVVTDAIEKGPVFSPDGQFVAFLRVGLEVRRSS